MACYAPVSLRSPSVCRAAVGVNVYQCQSLTIVGMLLSLALICCSDLYFVFSLSMYLTGLALLFVSQSLSNDLFYVAEQYGSSDSKEWHCDLTKLSLDSSVKFDLHFFAAEPKKMWPCYRRGAWDGRGGYSVDPQFRSRLKYLWNHGLEILFQHSRSQEDVSLEHDPLSFPQLLLLSTLSFISKHHCAELQPHRAASMSVESY